MSVVAVVVVGTLAHWLIALIAVFGAAVVLAMGYGAFTCLKNIWQKM